MKLNAQSSTVASNISSTTEGRRIAWTLVGAGLLPLLLLLSAFLSGGFDEWTYSLLAAVVWLGLAVVRWRRPSAAACVLLALGGWTLLSGTWGAPGPALRVAPLVFLYAGVLVAAELVDARPLLTGVWASCSVVVCAGLAARCAGAGFALAGGADSQRLDWPLGYANGLGLVAVVCILLSAGLEWRRERLALASAALAGSACLLTYSRTALAAGAVAAVLLVALRPAAARGLGAGAIGALAAALLGLAGPTTGPRLLPVVVLAAAAGAALPPFALRISRRALLAAAVPMAAAGLVVARPLAARDAAPAPDARNASRLVDLSGHGRTALWRSAWREGAAHPLAGGGAGTWPRAYAAQTHTLSGPANAHSLELETLAELGAVGLALLLAFVWLAFRSRPAEPWAPAAVAVLAAWALTSAVDWDWQLPAATLPAILAAGALTGARRAPPLRLAPLGAAAALAVGLACGVHGLGAALLENGIRTPSRARLDARLLPGDARPWAGVDPARGCAVDPGELALRRANGSREGCAAGR